MGTNRCYVVGIDYGTDSCRALIVDASNGREVGSSVQYYPRWKKGLYCDASQNRYRQHPLDYIETLIDAVKEALSKAPAGTAGKIVGMSFDTTGSTPVLTDRNGTPLGLLPGLEDNPNALFILWKDHTAVEEAEEINALCRKWDTDYTAYSGGIYSSEWVWSKVLHVLRVDKSVRESAYSWVEHCDWMPALLTGNTLPEKLLRSRCAAGHKAMWNESWGGLPSESFLSALDLLLSDFRRRLFIDTYPADTKAGVLTKEWALKLGLPEDVVVSVGALDCHVGAVGAEIKPGTFVRVIGTSTCDIMLASYEDMKDKLIPGICGQVDGSVVPGMIGLEAGQSAFGDLYAWFRQLLEWPLQEILNESGLIDDDTKAKLIEETSKQIIPLLSGQAARIPLDEHLPVATDWMNGRRTPDADQMLKGTIDGLSLGTTAPQIFRTLVEATAFGSKAIFDRFLENEIAIREVVGIGGISLKSPFVMQTLADVLGRPIKAARSEQTCALGAAMFAAVAGGVYSSVTEAQAAMGQGFSREYLPDEKKHLLYLQRYQRYRKIGFIQSN